MVCSALIKDEKQQQRAAPRNKQGAGQLWHRRSPELFQIQGLGLPVPEDTAEVRRAKSHAPLQTPRAPHSPSIMLLANIYRGENSPSSAPFSCTP